MVPNDTGRHLQECLRRGGPEPLGRAEPGRERLAQACRNPAGNDRRGPAGPSPLIFPAGLVWESTPAPKSQGGRAPEGRVAHRGQALPPPLSLRDLSQAEVVRTQTHPPPTQSATHRPLAGRGSPGVRCAAGSAARCEPDGCLGLNPGSSGGTGPSCPSFLIAGGGDHSIRHGRMLSITHMRSVFRTAPGTQGPSIPGMSSPSSYPALGLPGTPSPAASSSETAPRPPEPRARRPAH